MMSLGISKLLSFFFFFFFFFSYLSLCSGTLVGFSYDARRNRAISSPRETISFLKRNKVFPSQIKVLVPADHRILDSISTSGGVLVDLYLNETQIENIRTSKASAISWLKSQLSASLQHTSITSIVVSTCSTYSLAKEQLPLLLPTLETVLSVLKSFNLDRKVKVSTIFSLPILENLERQQHHTRDLHQIAHFISKCRSFVILETKIDGELSMGDQFIRTVTQAAISAVTAFHYRDVPIVLNVKSSVVPSSVEVAQFSMKMKESIESHGHIFNRVTGIFAELSPMQESVQRELHREEEQMFDFSHRELISNPLSATKLTQHDDINSQTPPVTIPPANTSPTFVTVPSTNPGSANTTTPPAAPITNPVVTTPITAPPTNPVTPPSTVPAGNPVTTPPPTNPATNSPVAPPGSISITPPATTPPTNPLPPPATTSPTGSGQTWCVAKMGASESALQAGIDYACGIGAADCSAIQPSGSCYNPNTRQNHASYAFNSYYQKNPALTSCDFKGTATLINTNPSTGSCIYPSSGSSSTVAAGTPPNTAAGTPSPNTAVGTPPSSTSTPPSVLNSSFPTPTATAPTNFGFGFGPPPGVNTSDSVATGLRPLFVSIVLASSLVTGTLIMDM